MRSFAIKKIQQVRDKQHWLGDCNSEDEFNRSLCALETEWNDLEQDETHIQATSVLYMVYEMQSSQCHRGNVKEHQDRNWFGGDTPTIHNK